MARSAEPTREEVKLGDKMTNRFAVLLSIPGLRAVDLASMPRFGVGTGADSRPDR